MNILGKGLDPKFWEEAREKDCYARVRKDALDMWEKDCQSPIISLPYSKFKMFWTTGDRSQYESCYFRRRRALCCCSVLSLLYPEESKYIERLNDELFAVTEEYTWCLPAHHGKLDYNYEKMIDLFAAETAFTLSEIYTLLRHRLDPLVRNRIIAEVNRRVITPYCEREREYGWETTTSNWAAVCMCSVAGAVMHIRPELFPELEPRFTATMESYLSGFEEDGICLEGVGSWHYGFGFFAVYADMVRSFTDGRINYFERPLIKTISTFIQKMFLNGKACVSFADGHCGLTYHLGLVHRLKTEYPGDVLVYDPALSYNCDSCGRYCVFLRSFLWLDEDTYNNPNGAVEEVTYYAENSKWFVKKTPEYGFAAKAGHNGELHNNNDVGSFIFAKDGKQLLIDPGAGRYCRQYFGPERYTFIQTSSRGHNVPIINGNYQKPGKSFSAKDVEVKDGVFTQDMAGAYGIEELKSLKRSFSFEGNTVYLKDEFNYVGEGNITERFVSNDKPEVLDGQIKIAGCTLYYDKAFTPVVSTADAMKNNGSFYYLVDFVLPEGTKEFKVSFN